MREPPPKPIPPDIHRVCDGCHKPWGTCWCRHEYIALFVGLPAVIVCFLTVMLLIGDGSPPKRSLTDSHESRLQTPEIIR